MAFRNCYSWAISAAPRPTRSSNKAASKENAIYNTTRRKKAERRDESRSSCLFSGVLVADFDSRRGAADLLSASALRRPDSGFPGHLGGAGHRLVEHRRASGPEGSRRG